MRAGLLVVTSLALWSCREQVAVVTADCPGALLVQDIACDGACRVDAEQTVFAQDTDECRFVRWEGSCGDVPLCRARDTGGRASFERIAWPLTVDLSAAPNFTATIEPGATRCEARCDVWVPVGEAFSVRAVGPVGQKPGFAGDCSSIADTCSGVSDRARTVRVRAEGDEISLRLVANGEGVVTLDAPATTCSANQTCVARVTRGSTVTARAVASAGQMLQGWSRAECTDATCSFRATADDELVATFIPTRRLQLAQSGGVGGVRINGVSYALPVDQQLARGTVVALVAEPAADDVLFRFEGLPCETPRVIDECRFNLVDDVTGLVRFHRLFQWASGGWNAVLGSLMAVDGGALALVTANRDLPVLGLQVNRAGDGLLLVDADGGTQVVQRGDLEGAATVFRGVADTIWISGAGRSSSPNAARVEFSWGVFDAGVDVRRPGAGHPYFLRLNQQYEVEFANLVTLPPTDGDLALPSGPLVLSETSAHGVLRWSGAFDGGSSPEGVGVWDSSFNLERFTSFARRPTDVTHAGATSWQVSRYVAPSTSVGNCQVTGQGVSVLARLDANGECVAAAASAAIDGGASIGSLTLARGSDDEVHVFEKWSSQTSAGLHGVRLTAWSQTLQVLHERELRLDPIGVADPLGIVFAHVMGDWLVFSIDVAAFRTDVLTVGEVQVRCPPSSTGDDRLLVRQRRDTGEIDWAVCLLGTDNGVDRFGTTGQFQRSVVIGDGQLITAAVGRAEPDAGATFRVGSTVLPSNGTQSLYFMMLTPPLAP